jgi:hypothetical protein
MNTASELLVIILSSVLVVFLLLSIVVVIKTIQIVNSLKRITTKAEKIADSAEAIGSFFQKSTTPIAITRLIHNITESVFHNEKRTKKGER